ncbi:hypothetical protein KAR91_49045, partial [Candidatus Pacearchaeota archaeon]|nr:hypothetical protein [Candidatus Pacearchaeota archaeon]
MPVCPVPKNERIFLHNLYNEDDEVYRIDWSPLPVSPNHTDIEYLLAQPVRVKVSRLMTTAWNLKTIYLALNPGHKRTPYILELDTA